jgi:hypothetical protein
MQDHVEDVLLDASEHNHRGFGRYERRKTILLQLVEVISNSFESDGSSKLEQVRMLN